MTDEVLMEDWHLKVLDAGTLSALFREHGLNGLADKIEGSARACCRPLNATEILEAQGFRHSCGGNIVGCRCLESWYRNRGLDQFGKPLPEEKFPWLGVDT